MNDDLSLTPAGANLIKHFESCLQKHGVNYTNPITVRPAC